MTERQTPENVIDSEIVRQKAIKAYNQMLKHNLLLVPFGSPDTAQRHQVYAQKPLDLIARALEKHELTLPLLSELRVLDLGCGTDDVSYDGHQPIFPRFLAASGAEVVGVDAGPTDPEIDDVYKHVQLELKTDPEFSLPDELKKRGIDQTYNLIYSAALIDSYTSPFLVEILKIDKKELKKRIIVWSETLLEEGGFLVLDDARTVYQKKDGKLTLLSDPVPKPEPNL